MKLNKTSLGFSLGIVWGLGLFLITLWIMIKFPQGQHYYLGMLKNVYLGYTVSIPGAVIGLIWGFIDGFIAGWLIAGLYNLFSREVGETKKADEEPAAEKEQVDS